MCMANETEILLDKKGVDSLTEVINNWMRSSGIKGQNLIGSRLAVETIILVLAKHYDFKQKASFTTKRRFGVNTMVMTYEGEPYNPIGKVHDKWVMTLVSTQGLTPNWKHKNGINELSLRIPRQNIKSEIILIASALLAVMLGIAGRIIPDNIMTHISGFILQPIETIFSSLLSTFSGILVFLAVISGICGIGTVSELNKIGKYVIGRFVLMSFIGAGIMSAVMIPFFSFNWGDHKTSSQISSLYKMLIDIVPSNPITPFAEGNMLQIVFMALIIGSTILLIGNKTPVLQEGIQQANAVSMRIVEVVCSLLPFYIFASITLLLWKNGLGIFRSIWKPIVFTILSSTILMAIKLVVVSVKYKVSPVILIRKMFPTYLVGLTTASSVASLGISLDANEHKFGVPSSFNNFVYPLGILLYCSTCSGGFIAIVYYLTEINGNNVDIVWFFSVLIFITIISSALPPVSGGTLIGLGVILSQFAIPNSCLGIAGTLALMLDFIMTSSKVAMMHLETVIQADHFKYLDKDILRSK